MGDTGTNFLNDIGIITTMGMVNVKKGRFNVPFSGAQMGEWGKGYANILTGEQMRDKTDDFFSSGTMKTVETVAGAIALTVATFGVGSALAAPAAGATAAAEGGAVAAEGAGTIAASAAAPSVAGTEAGLTGAAALTAGAPVTASGAIPVAAGALESATAADVAGAALTGPIGGMAAPEAAGLAATASPALASSAPAIAQPAIADLSAAPAMSTLQANGVPLGMTNLSPSVATELSGAAPALNSAPSTSGWFASLSPGAQTALITGGLTVAQMGTGAMSGIFQGVSAQKRLELDQLINSQRQNQVQYLNRNNQYAPLLTFKQPTGLANTVKA